MKSKKGCQHFYDIFVSDIETIAKIKWETLADDTVPNFWKVIYRICFKSIADNELKWFQYKIVNNVLATKHYLYKIKLSESDKCQLCNSQTETIIIFFRSAKKLKNYGKMLKKLDFYVNGDYCQVYRNNENFRIYKI